MVRFRRGQALDGLPQPVRGLPIAELRELSREKACFDKVGVGGPQRVLGGRAPMGPADRPVADLRASSSATSRSRRAAD
jgi:hypothetical protein